jgi:hypothetical protein
MIRWTRAHRTASRWRCASAPRSHHRPAAGPHADEGAERPGTPTRRRNPQAVPRETRSRISAASIHSLPAALLFAVAPLGAGTGPHRRTGHASRRNRPLPASGVLVSLHRIGRTAQGVVDSARTPTHGHSGSALPDTTAVFLVSARYAGIEYFSDPAQPGRDTALALIVSDTSSRSGSKCPRATSSSGGRRRRPTGVGPHHPCEPLRSHACGPGHLDPTWSLRLPGARNLEVEQRPQSDRRRWQRAIRCTCSRRFHPAGST